jgi:hypothetical protein
MESVCCRLQQTTSTKNGAQTAHVSDHIEDEELTVGSTKFHTVPMAAHASMAFGLQLDSGDYVHGWMGNGKSMKCFGGPGEIRTHDLFHAMEARSQLRHRPDSCLRLV